MNTRNTKTKLLNGECCANREQEKIDAARYRWLRDRLAIEDIERIEREFFGEPEEAESIKTDIAVDAAMRSNGEVRGASVTAKHFM